MSQASPENRATGGATPLLSHPKDKSPERDMASFVLPESSRGSRILCCMALCLLCAGESQLRWDVPPPNIPDCCGSVHLPPGLVQALSPSSTGSVAAGVTQSPRHLIKGHGGEAVLKCHPISRHECVLVSAGSGDGPPFPHSVLGTAGVQERRHL